MDRSYAQPLDVPSLARIAHVSQAHFIRPFRATFGETPRFYGTDCALRDPFGNHIRIGQPAANPSAAEPVEFTKS